MAVALKSTEGARSYLECRPSAVLAQALLDTTAAMGERTDKRILIVDDDRTVRAALAAHLILKGYRASCAESSEAAIHHLEESGDTALAIVDVNMPGMDGFALLEQVKVRFPNVAVIMVTGGSTPDAMRRAWQYGALAMLTKPVPAQELLVKIEEALAQSCCGEGIASP